MNTVQDQQLFKTNCLTRVLPQTRHPCGRPVLEEVPLDNKEELRTRRPSAPCQSSRSLRNSTCPHTTLECVLLGIIDYATRVTDPTKLKAIEQWEPPKSVKVVRSFIGFCNFYQKFIPNFSMLAQLLHDLIKKGVTFQWGKEQDDMFVTFFP